MNKTKDLKQMDGFVSSIPWLCIVKMAKMTIFMKMGKKEVLMLLPSNFLQFLMI